MQCKWTIPFLCVKNAYILFTYQYKDQKKKNYKQIKRGKQTFSKAPPCTIAKASSLIFAVTHPNPLKPLASIHTMKTFSLHHWDNSELPKLTIATTFSTDSWRAQTFPVHINTVASISGVIAVELNTFFRHFQSLTRTGLSTLVPGCFGWPSDCQLFLDLFFFSVICITRSDYWLVQNQTNWTSKSDRF